MYMKNLMYVIVKMYEHASCVTLTLTQGHGMIDISVMYKCLTQVILKIFSGCRRNEIDMNSSSMTFNSDIAWRSQGQISCKTC